MGPQTLQTGQHITILRQLDLRLGLSCLSTHGKNIEDKTRPVQDLHLQFCLDITNLLGAKLIVEDDHTHRLGSLPTLFRLWTAGIQPVVIRILLLLDVLLDFFELTLADIGHLTGTLNFLRETLHSYSTSGIGQKFQLVEVFFCLGFVLLLGNQTYQHGSLGLDL